MPQIKNNHFCLWFLISFCLGSLFFYQHVVFHLEQDADYRYLTVKTTFNTDTVVYAGLTRSILKKIGFPSETGLYEHRGETNFAFMTYTLPCWFTALLTLSANSNIDIGYQLSAFFSIFLSALLLYPFLYRLASNRTEIAIFFLVTIYCFSTFLRPELLLQPNLIISWIRKSLSAPYFFNNFMYASNIQISFLFYVCFLTSLFWLIESKEKGYLLLLYAGVALASLFYTYFYYIHQGILIYFLLTLYFAIKKDWQHLRYLLGAGLLAIMLISPIIFDIIKTVDTQLMSDMKLRFGMTDSADYTNIAGSITVFLVSYVLLKIGSRSWNNATMILVANLTAVAVILYAGKWANLDIQTGHFLGRAFYPIMGLAIADFLYSSFFIPSILYSAINSKWANWSITNTVTQKVAAIILLSLAVWMFSLQARTVIKYCDTTIGYNLLEHDTEKLLNWISANHHENDVFLTLDSELIRLIPVWTGSWLFIASGNTSVAHNDELLERLTWASYLLGISEEDFSKHLDRSFSWWRLSQEMVLGNWLNLDFYPEALWTYTFFGRSFRVETLRKAGQLSLEDEELVKSRELRQIDDYFPLKTRAKLLSKYRDIKGKELIFCPYKITYVILSNIHEKEIFEANSINQQFDFIVNIGRYYIYLNQTKDDS